MSNIIAVLAAALAERKQKLEQCPVRRAAFFDKPCPTCRATASGPCWLNVAADAALVDTVKEIVAAQSAAQATQAISHD